MIQRRWQHAEQRRVQLLNKCCATRRELMEKNPDEDLMSTLSSPRRGEVDPSPARLSAQRYRESQEQRYKQLEEQRRIEGLEKLAKLQETTEMVVENKNRICDSVREKGAERWEQVVDHHDHAAESFFQQSSQKFEKMLQRDHQRDTLAYSARSQRENSAKEKGIRREGRHQEVLTREQQEKQRAEAKAREWLAEVERRQKLAEEHYEERKEKYGQLSVEHQKELQEHQRRAVQNELDKRTFHLQLLDQIDERAENAQFTLQEQREQKLLEYNRKNSEYQTIVQRGNELTESRKQQASAKLQQKEAELQELLLEQSLQKLESIEQKREATLDKIEDITRTRKANDYKREQKLRHHVLQCDHGLCTSPRRPDSAK